MKKSILSCIQPSGSLHLGNYFGAIKNWVSLQNEYECIYGIADYHPMTLPHNPQTLKTNTIEMVLDLVACGVKMENIFIQSMIPEHAELCWILGCNTSHGQLKKQKQFAEKTKQISETTSDKFVSGGLFYYPVLQAADILIYHAHYVPVGKDQEQHLELARNVAERFNLHFGVNYFIPPEPMFTEIPKLMSLTSPNKKMSKSMGEKHYLGLFESQESIIKKIRSAVTDCGNNESGVSKGVENLFTILDACGKLDLKINLQIEAVKGTLKYSVLKDEVAKAIIELTTPLGIKRAELAVNKQIVLEEVYASSQVIRLKAQETVKAVKEIVGLYSSFVI
jgi:tryptophanyl-tRNA synthetase